MNPFDFWGSLNGLLKDACTWLVNFFQGVLTANPNGGSLQETLYGFSWGYGHWIAYVVTLALLQIILWRRDKFKNLAEAVLVLVAFSTIARLWFGTIIPGLGSLHLWLCGQVQSLFTGQTGTELANYTIPVPVIDNVGISILAFFNTVNDVFWALVLYGIIDILGLAALAFFLLSLAASPVGPRAKKTFHVVVSVILMARLYAHPAGILCMELGKWAQSALPLGKSSLGVFISLKVSFLLLPIFLVLAAVLSYYTPSLIEGLVRGKSQVMSGDVTAKLEDGQTIPIETIHGELDRIAPMPEISYTSMDSAAADSAFTPSLAPAATAAGAAEAVATEVTVAETATVSVAASEAAVAAPVAVPAAVPIIAAVETASVLTDGHVPSPLGLDHTDRPDPTASSGSYPDTTYQ